jgi:hypothetical protein
MRKLILIIFYFVLILDLNAQTDSCKVLLEKISGKYTGECLNGFANGKGKSIGEDTYIGIFKAGLPNGIGKYIFKNGDIFQGNWLNGQKNGKGKFEFKIDGKKNTVAGYWKKDEYVGVNEPDVTFRVTSSSGIIDYKVEKNKPVNEYDTNNSTFFSIKSSFMDFLPKDLKINKSSGEIIQVGKKFGIKQYFCPLHCEISYSILIGSHIRQCQFIIDILEKGTYTVNLNND